MSRSVFLALRPEIFGKPKEHITLRYYSQPESHHLWHDALALDHLLPTQIEVIGFANYKSFDGNYYAVAMVDQFKNPALWTNSFPHITLHKSSIPIPCPQYEGDEISDIVENLWFGRSDGNGDYDWFRYEKDGYEIFTTWLG